MNNFGKSFGMLVIGLFLLYAESAQAMTCTRYDNDVKAFPIIFKGNAISTSTLTKPRNVEMGSIGSMTVFGSPDIEAWIGKTQSTKFNVIESYKGDLGSEVEIFHQSESIVGTSYKEGMTYIIFARKGEDGLSETVRCDPVYILSDLEDNGELPVGLLQLESFKALVKEFKATVARQPHRSDFYLSQGKFYENYNDYPKAETAYKTGMQENFGWHRGQIENGRAAEDSLTEYTWPQNAVYVEGYGRVLFLQEKYDESLVPLKASGTGEASRLYKTALVNLGKFKELGNSGLDFSGIEVTKLDLSDAQLEGANFSGAKIQYLMLRNTNLNKANFSNAEMGMEVDNAQFKGANFSHAKIGGDLTRGAFEGADFSNSHWAFGHIKDSSFVGANFSNAKLTIYQEITNSDMSKANFEGAYVQRLSGVKIDAANLNRINTQVYQPYHSDFSSVDLSAHDLSNGNFRSINLRQAKLVGTNMSNADLTPNSEPADLRGADLTGANLSQTKMFFALYDCQTKFPESFFASKNYMIPVWDKCDTPKPPVSFVGLKLVPDKINYGGFLKLRRHGSPELKDIDLEGASFEGSNIGMLSCMGCNLRGVDFSNADIMQLSFRGSDLRGAKFKNVKIDPESYFGKSDLRGADLSGISFVKKGATRRYHSRPNIKGSVYDATTIWPKGFDPEEAGAIKVQ